QLKKLNDTFGLHPQMTGLADLWNDQALCVVQGVGYPNPTQSHFRSMDIWQAANMAETLNEGWIGKALKSMPATPSFHLAQKESAPRALSGAPVRVPSIQTLEEFQLKMAAASRSDKQQQREVIEGAAEPKTDKPSLLDFVQRT